MNIFEKYPGDQNATDSEVKRKILFISSEASPFVSTGGLGMVVGALANALAEAGPDMDVRVVIPLYGETARKYIKDGLEKAGAIYVDLGWRHQYCGIYRAKHGKVTYYFIDNEYYFNRADCYGHFDDGERFAFFCRAVLEILEYIDFIPDIIHTHDWQSALIPIYLHTAYAHKQTFKNIKTVFTIHNVEYQGVYDKSILGDIFDIPSEYMSVVEYNGALNLMKGALLCSDSISMLSASYAKETHELYRVNGLEPIINTQASKIRGILHGIDYDLYNPETDRKIFKNYNANKVKDKKDNKLHLQTMHGMRADCGIPVIAVIAHLVEEKGINFIADLMDRLVEQPAQIVLLGNGERKYELLFEAYREMYPEKIAVKIKYDNDTARKIYAGADILLNPPYVGAHNVKHLIASRYGAVPLVHETGEIDETASYDAIHNGGNGFTFREYAKDNMIDTINRTLNVYYTPNQWEKLAQNAMRRDLSWNTSATEYIKVYNGL